MTTSRFTRGNTNPPAVPEEVEKEPRPLTHGGYSALRLYRERGFDLKRDDHRALYEWRESIIEDLGGQEVVDTFQRAMIDRATELLIVISKMAEHVEQTGIMQGSELAPCLRSNFLQYVNSFRHTLTAAFDHSTNGKPKRPLTLEDYLKSKEETENEGSRPSSGKEETGIT